MNIETAHDHLSRICDLAVWMSGSEDFATDGRAGEAWAKHRDDLFEAIAYLESAATQVRFLVVQVEGKDLLGERHNLTYNMRTDAETDEEFRQITVEMTEKFYPLVTVDRVCWHDIDSGYRYVEKPDRKVLFQQALETMSDG